MAPTNRPAAEEQGLPQRVTFVCSGNICRSPSAEVILRRMLDDAQWRGTALARIDSASAGTGDWHAGDDMDDRSRDALLRHGYQPPVHRARQFTAADFAGGTLVVALDQGHFGYLSQLALGAADPEQALDSLVLLRSYDPLAVADGELGVPDPYYGHAADFDLVIEQVERACAGLVRQLASAMATPPADRVPR